MSIPIVIGMRIRGFGRNNLISPKGVAGATNKELRVSDGREKVSAQDDSEKCDEQEHFAAPEGQSSYGSIRTKRGYLMPTYESIFVCPPDLPPEELEELVRKFEKIITQGQGEIISCDKLGRRKLAYEIKGYKEGFMYCLNFNSPPNVIPELENNYRVTDKVIRHLIVKVDKKKLKEEKVTSEESKVEEGRESPTSDI
mgnify:CR=1 FL=1